MESISTYKHKIALLAGCLLAEMAAPAASQETQNRLRFELGAGLSASPVYEGASGYLFSPNRPFDLSDWKPLASLWEGINV